MGNSNSEDGMSAYWSWESSPYDTTEMMYSRFSKDELVGYTWMGSVRFSTIQRNYTGHCRYAEQQVFLHKKDAKAWVETTSKLGYAGGN